jgi:glyoxylase-like metal-dependent hydrolase (beta-lactamase superfamily II)
VLLRETFPVGAFQCNCTVLACGDTRDAIVIDPGGEVEHIAELVAHHDLTVRAIVHTHAHLDHIYCTHDIKQAHGGEVCLHPGDRFLYDGLAMQARMFGWAPRPGTPVERWLADGDTIAFGQRSLLVLHTPGHTPGSVCFEVTFPGAPTLVFAGDTLFRRGVGRTDLPGGDARTLHASIKDRLYTRDLDALVVPGHGPTTTLGDEARANPWVRA